MPYNLPATRLLMNRLRQVMAEDGDTRFRLDQVVRIIASTMVADVCSIYLRDKAPENSKPEKVAAIFVQLLEFWGEMVLEDINGRSCRDYVAWRCAMPRKAAKPEVTGNAPRMVTPAGARAELEYLRAAVNYHQSEGYHREIVTVTLPKRGAARHRYLRRSELAAMVWIAWRMR